MLSWLDEIQTNLLPKFLHIPCYFPRFPNRTQKYIFFSENKQIQHSIPLIIILTDFKWLKTLNLPLLYSPKSHTPTSTHTKNIDLLEPSINNIKICSFRTHFKSNPFKILKQQYPLHIT
ncbi:hypothetical protein HanPSC8_Chr14g0622721 [Helianthus annuus]|nr:hypothetical protein HanPSC8_Chr14g0622721 [Helianthus annuus]